MSVQIWELSLGIYRDLDYVRKEQFCNKYQRVGKTSWVILINLHLTTKWNNSFHYGSDARVEIATIYHSVIRMEKFHGDSYGTLLVYFTKGFLMI